MENAAAYIPLDRRRAVAAGAELPVHTSGAALFADISGFTPLTEALVRAFGPRRGADELTRQLNEVYSAIIAPVHNYGGAVIGFSGDAIACWFDDSSDSAPAGLARACAAALEMQRAMAAFAHLDYPGGAITLAIKTAVAAGPIQRHLVGDPSRRLIDVLAGALLDRLAQTEQHATQEEVLLDAASASGWAEWLQGEWVERGEARYFRVQALGREVSPSPAETEFSLPDDLVRPWLLPPVYARIHSQQGRFLAELRPAAALFLKFSGLDFASNPNAGNQLDHYIRWVQSVVDRFEGSLIQLTTGDKGSYLYAAFGAPVAHDDDAARAVSAALTLVNSPAIFPFISAVQMGISHGRMRVGAYGSADQRTYGVLGDETNVAARLMSKADSGQILISQRVAELVDEGFQVRALGAMRFKGKSEPLSVFVVEGERNLSGDEYRALFPNRLEGRMAELAQMQAVLADVSLDHRGRLLRVEGEAGVGKSHLAAVFLEDAQRQGVQAAVGACQSTGRDVAYGAVGTIARQLLGLAGQEERSVDAQIAHLRTTIDGLNPDWLVRLPLLGDLLHLPIPDNPTIAAFTPQLRQEALIALALEIVQLRARQRPLLLLIEDVHWIDEASSRLVLALARIIQDSRILLLLVHRPVEADGASPALDELLALAAESVVALAELPSEGIVGLVRNRLGGPVDDLALALIQVQAQGNAFFTEELVESLAESRLLVQVGERWSLSPGLLAQLQADGCVQRMDGRWQLVADAPLAAVSLGIPDTIHGAILSRLDRLPEDVKLTLKLASVIGRVFELDLLAGIYPDTRPNLSEQIETLSRRDFARLERPQPQMAYIFKHNITQEVVYRTLLESQQREVHTAVAERLESMAPQAIERLAFHYRHGDLTQPSVRGKALHYLDAAGKRARREYANETALGYVERALALEIDWARQTAKVELLHILGRREEEQIALDRLDSLPDVPPADVQLLWGQYHESMSDYPAALAAMDAAAHSAQAVTDSRGLIRVLGRTGLIHWRQGNYTESVAAYNHALKLLADAPDWAAEEADIRYGLGILHRQQGKFGEAQRELERALVLARQLENRPDEAKMLAALASIAEIHRNDYLASQSYNLQALALRRQIGDRAGEGASLLALGQSYSRLGQYTEALASFTEALAIQKALGNRWWEAIVWNELGIIEMLLGRYQSAQTDLTMALAIVGEIEAEVGEAYIQVNLGQVLRDTGDLSGAEAAFVAGLEFAVQRQDRHLEAICHSDSALLWMERYEYVRAMDAAQRAQALYAEIGTPYSATVDFATLARAALALGCLTEAATYADRAIALLIECNGDGPDFSHRDYWQCAQVLQAVGRLADAKNAQSVARRLLQEKAEKISDPVMRASFLENVASNREIWGSGENERAEERMSG
jgi:class 3 adenylate cyclase/tetratricopeptide (TPR) repeat protein